jgi:GH35 family endo-1,4-beta-xylanase
MGCDTKAFFLMDQDTVMDRFLELFNYATITYYSTVRWNQDFEPIRGEKRYDLRDAFFNQLKSHGITIEGRPLFWPHKSVTPDWLRQMSYDEVLRYVEQHVREVVGHYGDGMHAWEVVNEFHDWANETNLTPEQTIEVTRLACDVARDTAPNVHRLINNCCPFAEYVQMGEHSGGPAKYPQRTPWEFMRDLHDADVDFTITGVQMYFPWRDLQDTIIHIERFEEFGRPVQLTEVGASSGPSERSIVLDRFDIPSEPYVWHRPWDEELQADWLEGLYTLGYSKPWIEAVNWYDLDDDHAFIDNGGHIKSPHGEPKAAFHRLKRLQEEWKSL